MTLPRSGRAFDREVLAAADGWGAGRAGIAVVDRDGLVAERGSRDVALPWASVTKVVTAYTTLVAVERGVLGLDDPAGPPGSTVRHLLAHASGLAFDDDMVIAAPARTRIYTNTGYNVLAGAVERAAGRSFAALMRSWVLDPLEMTGARLEGPPAQGLVGTLRDLQALAFELLAPRLLPRSLLDEATAVAFPGLRGMLPGVGRLDPLDWGLGVELRAAKSPHWMGARNSPRTFGQFGGSGTFLWVDPVAGIGLAALTDRTFGGWALAAWPAISDAVLAAASG
ncbi:MAG: serine hydrolase domain-containing protein [Candidatus Limnocylindrales bacterium]